MASVSAFRTRLADDSPATTTYGEASTVRLQALRELGHKKDGSLVRELGAEIGACLSIQDGPYAAHVRRWADVMLARA